MYSDKNYDLDSFVTAQGRRNQTTQSVVVDWIMEMHRGRGEFYYSDSK